MMLVRSLPASLRRVVVCPTLALAAFLGGCATTTQAPDAVQVVDKAVLPQGTFVLVHRIWIENWHIQNYMPWHATREEAVDALRVQAAQRGADALTNVACIPVNAFWNAPRVFCHGDAVKLTPEGQRRATAAAAAS